MPYDPTADFKAAKTALWAYSEDQERDDHGRFGSGGSDTRTLHNAGKTNDETNAMLDFKVIKAVLLDYSPDQERDDHGRFGSGGSLEKDGHTEKALKTSLGYYAETARQAASVRNEAATAAKGDHPESNVLISGIRHEQTDTEVYRGLLAEVRVFSNARDEDDWKYDSSKAGLEQRENTARALDLLSWKQGQEIQLTPQSFSKADNVANGFAVYNYGRGRDSAQFEQTPIVLKLAAGAAGVDVNAHLGAQSPFPEQKEVLSGGRYRVAGVREITLKQGGHYDDKNEPITIDVAGREISLEQVGVF